jgi:hypothetical protein
MEYLLKATESQDSRTIKFNLGDAKSKKSPTSSTKSIKLDEAFIDPRLSSQQTLFSSIEIPQAAGRHTSWKHPDEYSYVERHTHQPRSIHLTGDRSPFSYNKVQDIRNSEQELINMLQQGKRAIIRRDELDYTSTMYRDEFSSLFGGLKVQKSDLEYDSNIIIAWIRSVKWRMRKEYFYRNEQARIIQEWMRDVFRRIKEMKMLVKQRNEDAKIIQWFVRHIKDLGFAARVVQAFIANHRDRKPVERPICATGSRCTKRVGNRRTVNWAATVIQNKFRNTRTKPIVPRIRKVIFSSGLMTKRVVDLGGLLKKVLALQSFYRKLKARQLVSAKIIHDFVNEDIKKKCVAARKIQDFINDKKQTKKVVKINDIVLFTKAIRRAEIVPKRKGVIVGRVMMMKEARSLQVVKYVMLLQKSVKKFLALRKIKNQVIKIKTFCHFTKSIVRKTLNAKPKKNINSSGFITKRVCDLGGLLRKVIALQSFYRKLKARQLVSAKIIQDFVDEEIKKKCKAARTIQNFINDKKDRKQAVQINAFCYFTKTNRVAEVAPRPRAITKKCVLVRKEARSMRLVMFVINLQRAIKKFLALIRRRRNVVCMNNVCHFTKEIRVHHVEPSKRAIISQFAHFTKDIKTFPKIGKRPVLSDRRLLGKKCMSRNVFTIIMLLQRAVKRFLASRNIYIMEKPIIDETNQFATKWISSKKALNDASTIKKFCKVRPKPIVYKRKEVVNRFVLFTKDFKTQPKIFKRPLLVDRSLLRKKCFSPKIFQIIMLLQKAVRKFLEGLHIKAISLPIIDDSKQFTSKIVTSKKFIDEANRIKGFMKFKPKVIQPERKPLLTKGVIFTKEIKKGFVAKQKPRVFGPQLKKTCKSNAVFGVIMSLQKAVRRFLKKENPAAIELPVISQKHQYTGKKIKSRMVDDYAKRIQDAWRGYKNRPIIIPEEIKPIVKKRGTPLSMSKKITSTRFIKYIIHLQRFFRIMFKRMPAVIHPKISRTHYYTKEIISAPPTTKHYPRVKPIEITKSYRLNVTTRKRLVVPMVCRKTKSSVKLGILLKIQRYIRKFLKLRVKPQPKPGVQGICLFTKRIKHYPEKRAIKLQGILMNFIMIQRRKKAIAKDYIRRMAIQNSLLQLKKAAMYTRHRLYNIDFVITLERQAVKVAQEIVFMKLVKHAKMSKNVLNEVDERENYYYRTIKGLRNLSQTTDVDRIPRDVANGIAPTFRLVDSKFPQEVRNIYSYKWYTYERVHDDDDLWQTHVYKSKSDPNFINMVKYLLREHELPNGYVEKRIEKTPIHNLTIFALLYLAETILYDLYNDLVCKQCYCKKEEDADSCHCKCHEKLKVRMTVSRKQVVEEDELDPLTRISTKGLRPKRKYDKAYDQLIQQKEMEDKPRKKGAINDREPVRAVELIKNARNSNASRQYRDIYEDTVDCGNLGCMVDEKVYR